MLSLYCLLATPEGHCSRVQTSDSKSRYEIITEHRAEVSPVETKRNHSIRQFPPAIWYFSNQPEG